ncbi:hypothetical protein ACWDT5_06155 [Rhodococcus aetherivorans]|uniref:hypothetical protein n=1 Tax=Rhodococcus TaxID=1827 RepID=UPI0002D23DE8|nr:MULTISPECIES: hypothetical protein [Rhodococcus]ANZ23716.1 hypothetical protein A4U64_02630 [Rhodococcus sp. WB1]KDE11850.1 hypothetical protein N505_0119715 [Rhodococcus aetherivorans]MDV6294184.1 hypothetical protein [Rhodococcus aetherivorans]OLL18939.1 hypothetical protein BKE56_002355 [Rhodococcus sp. M8]PND49395.1 hypothetical protein CQZ88_25535 [Rhodococcus sp. ENV425]
MHNLESVDPQAITQPIAQVLTPGDSAAEPVRPPASRHAAAAHSAPPAAEVRRVKRLTYGDEPRRRSLRPDFWSIVGALALVLAIAFVVVALLVAGNRPQPSYRPNYAPSGLGAALVPAAAVV